MPSVRAVRLAAGQAEGSSGALTRTYRMSVAAQCVSLGPHGRSQAPLCGAKATQVMTFKEAAEAYNTLHEQKWRNAKHRKQFLASLACYAYPVLGDTTVCSIDTAAVLRVVEPIWLSKTETANRVRGRIESVLERFGSPNYRRSPLARKRLDCGLHRARAENDKIYWRKLREKA